MQAFSRLLHYFLRMTIHDGEVFFGHKILWLLLMGFFVFFDGMMRLNRWQVLVLIDDWLGLNRRLALSVIVVRFGLNRQI